MKSYCKLLIIYRTLPGMCPAYDNCYVHLYSNVHLIHLRAKGLLLYGRMSDIVANRVLYQIAPNCQSQMQVSCGCVTIMNSVVG